MTIRANKFAANCANSCGTRIPAGAGRLVKEDGAWLVLCADATTCAAAREANTTKPAAAECTVELLCSGPCADAAAHEAFQIAHQAARKAALNRPARRTSTSRRRRACVTGGNCSSHTGRDCGGYNCDAN